MSQLLRNIPWLNHTTSPVWLTITFVFMTAELYCGSALRTKPKSWKKRVAPLLAIDIKLLSWWYASTKTYRATFLSFYHFPSTCRFSSTTAISFFYRQNHRLLVVENRVRPPDAIVRNTNHSDPRELRGVPFQMMVRPNLCHPAIGRQYLILLVLRTKNRQDLSRKIPRGEKYIWMMKERFSLRRYARQICESYHRGVLLPSCHLS